MLPVLVLLVLLIATLCCAQMPTNIVGGGALPGATTGEPYVLPGARMTFVDWLYVRPGAHNWLDAQGNGIATSRAVKAGPWDARFVTEDMPRGIKFVVERAEKRGPIIERDRPLVAMGLSAGTLLKDGDKYRLWAGCQDDQGAGHEVYFESTDGLVWERPNLKLVDWGGETENNVLLGLPGAIFLDPTAPPEQRYKAVGTRDLTKERYDELCAKYPDRCEPRAWRADVGVAFALFGAYSPDGYHWTDVPEPLAVEHADTQNIGCWDALLGKYVLWTRNWWLSERAPGYAEGQGQPWYMVGRRSIGRSEAATFDQFPLSEIVLHSPPDMLPSEVLYTNCYGTYPGAPEARLMFPAVWDMASDSTRIVLASSTDSRYWDWLPNGTLFETGEFGEFDGGTVFAAPNLVELPSGDFALPYTGYAFPHKYPRGAWAYDIGMAIWPKGRLVGLEAEQLGEFSTVAFIPPGKKLKINAVTKRGGSLQIAACNIGRAPFGGRDFGDCTPLIGDLHNAPVKWAGGEDLGAGEGEAVVLKVKLNQAKLYWFEFE